MSAPERFQAAETHASFRPEGTVAFAEAVDIVGAAIAFARETRVRRLLVDTTRLRGFGPPTTWERFWMAVRLATEARWMVKVALVAKAELIDPHRFGITVARNRGAIAQVFESEDAALAWLLDSQK